ncbi:hypothetical protein ADK60_18210, partial [Streptomyces sp. XY431]|uniref:hypothetical protein n=1 Tax=Streptomyces sp. XY431 TaxID=1415562 RepID=UPI0006AE8902
MGSAAPGGATEGAPEGPTEGLTHALAGLAHRSGPPEAGGADRSGGHAVQVTQPAALDGGLALA